MNVKDYLAKVAHTAFMDFQCGEEGLTKIYQSNYDNSYLTMHHLEDDIKYLADREITDFLKHGVGFSPKDGKWYGWTHRAIYGFEIGSTCSKGDCHYNPANKEEFIESCLAFWGDDEYHVKSWAVEGTHREEFVEYQDDPDPSDSNLTAQVEVPNSTTYGPVQQGAWVHYLYNNEVPNESLRGTENRHFTPYPKEFGRGEWTAKTLDDAKQMAIDFNEGVS